jgi:hypothetical protein
MIGMAAGGAALLLLGVGAWFFRVDEIPAELEPVVGDPAAVVIPAAADEPPLRIADLAGKTAFFIVFSPQMSDRKEGQALNRALNRWIFPPTSVGHIIGDAEGFGVFKDKVVEMLGRMQGELRFPIHVDYEGVFTSTFALPKGHHGFVVIGPDGTVLERISGGAEGAALERIREMLGATEPPPGPAMPEFSIGELDSTTCGHGTPCAIIFLGKDIARADVPGIDDGFDGEDDEEAKRLADPSIRMITTAFKAKLSKAKGAIVGRVSGMEFPTWSVVEASPEGRAAFGVAADEAVFVLIDAEGRMPMVVRGALPLYQWGRVADTLGVELDDDDD